MSDPHQNKGIEYFNSIAGKWDSWEHLESLNQKFDEGLTKFGVHPEEHILDVGCGTGNSTAAILKKLSQAGRITAVDYSEGMIEIAKTKVIDSRVRWVCYSIENLNGNEDTFDRIICYSVWPHIANHSTVAQLFHSNLKEGSKLHIWHLKSRKAINKIHSEASEVLREHLLAPASETAALLEKYGFVVEETLDDESGYLVTARKSRL